MQYIIFFIFTAVISFYCESYCDKGAGTTSGIILKQAIDPKGASMGNTGCASANDPNSSLFYNPAGLTRMENQEISSFYCKGLADSYFGFLGYCFPWEKVGSFCLGITTLQGGEITINGIDGSSETRKAQSDYLFSFACSRKLSYWDVSAGLNFKVLSSTLIETYNSVNFAFDFGLQKEFLEGSVLAGIAVQNIGTAVIYDEYRDYLPFSVRAGVAYVFKADYNNKFMLSADSAYSIEEKFNYFAGVEYEFQRMLAVRCGYRNDLNTITAGVGFNQERFGINYALGGIFAFSSSHLFSLSYKFGEIKEEKTKNEPKEKEIKESIEELKLKLKELEDKLDK